MGNPIIPPLPPGLIGQALGNSAPAPDDSQNDLMQKLLQEQSGAYQSAYQEATPYYNQPAQTTGEKLKHALGNVLFTLGEAAQGGLGAGIMSATPQGREQIRRGAGGAAAEAVAQRQQQAGIASGRVYGGQAAQQRAEAAMTAAQARQMAAETAANVAMAKLPASLKEIASKSNLYDQQALEQQVKAGLAPIETKIKDFRAKAEAALAQKKMDIYIQAKMQELKLAGQREADLENYHNGVLALGDSKLGAAIEKNQADEDYKSENVMSKTGVLSDLFGTISGQAGQAAQKALSKRPSAKAKTAPAKVINVGDFFNQAKK